jgi:hypothetical protein
MNPELSRAFVTSRMDDLRRDAALCAGPGPRLAPRTAARPQLRSRIGFALVETGLRLLADRSVTARPGLQRQHLPGIVRR